MASPREKASGMLLLYEMGSCPGLRTQFRGSLALRMSRAEEVLKETWQGVERWESQERVRIQMPREEGFRRWEQATVLTVKSSEMEDGEAHSEWWWLRWEEFHGALGDQSQASGGWRVDGRWGAGDSLKKVFKETDSAKPLFSVLSALPFFKNYI